MKQTNNSETVATMTKAKARNRFRLSVNSELLKNSARHDAAFYASYGMSANYIGRNTGLTKGQISYALKRAAVRITDYRNGLSNTCAVVMKLTQEQVDTELYRHLEKTLH